MSGGQKGRRGGAVSHGQSMNGRSKEYRTWLQIRKRCLYPRATNYRYYGGRGIQMCAAWRDSFAQFLRDVGPAPSSEHTIDRIEVNGHYEPGNVQWATKQEQRNNRREDGKVGRPWLGKKRNIPQGPDGRFLPKRVDGDYTETR